MESRRQLVRLGYVNVQGLSVAKWNLCCDLLDTCFDFLVLAETWFVERRMDPKDRRIVWKSVRVEKSNGGRCNGGIYLLGNSRARALVQGVPTSTVDTITFSVGKVTVSAVYLPPSMSAEEVGRVLASIASSSIVLGDVNTRFANLKRKGNQPPGPRDRQQAFSAFQQSYEFQLLQPLQDKPTGLPRHVKLLDYLTVDHCLAFKGLPDVRMWCFSNRSLRLDTDHDYCLSVNFRIGTEFRRGALDVIQRFRIGRLRDPIVQARFHQHISSGIERDSHMLWSEVDVDRLDGVLVGLCQRALRNSVGNASQTTLRRRPKRRGQAYDDLRNRQDPDAAVRLFKLAKASSQENGVILPTPLAEERGISAIDEVKAAFATRFQCNERPFGDEACVGHPVFSWTIDDVVREIRQQNGSKAPGCDGIHIQVLKSLLDTPFVLLLHRLFDLCVRAGKTPLRWNCTEIHLLSKDQLRRRDKTNLRPITLICMFRKIFEKLLLGEFNTTGWAEVHPAQAGFRPHYSTYTNAAVVHYAFASGSVIGAAFLDFRAAFDVVDHTRLDAALQARGCPLHLLSLLRSLTFRKLYSRVVVNGEVSEWFPRQRGVLQGSPISPALFNMFIDPLLHLLNVGYGRVPKTLFYADDGVLLARTHNEIQQLLDVVLEWTKDNDIELNAAKCGYVSRRSKCTLLADGERIPCVAQYQYLGFPVTALGIDFEALLYGRLTKAKGLVDWLRTYSDDWGPAHRLRVYRQYLAPIWEYGAPLVAAWAEEKQTIGCLYPNSAAYERITQSHRHIVGWVAGCSPVLASVAGNVMGLVPLQHRFKHLHLSFLVQLHAGSNEAPLWKILQSDTLESRACGFTSSLRATLSWKQFIQHSKPDVPLLVSLRSWRRELCRMVILEEATRFCRTRAIHSSCRASKGLFMADVSLGCSRKNQNRLLQYRLGLFRIKQKCKCGGRFVRGHEKCPALYVWHGLSRAERIMRHWMGVFLTGANGKFTDVDWLLNTKQVTRANAILEATEAKLNLVHQEAAIIELGAVEEVETLTDLYANITSIPI